MATCPDCNGWKTVTIPDHQLGFRAAASGYSVHNGTPIYGTIREGWLFPREREGIVAWKFRCNPCFGTGEVVTAGSASQDHSPAAQS